MYIAHSLSTTDEISRKLKENQVCTTYYNAAVCKSQLHLSSAIVRLITPLRYIKNYRARFCNQSLNWTQYLSVVLSL